MIGSSSMRVRPSPPRLRPRPPTPPPARPATEVPPMRMLPFVLPCLAARILSAPGRADKQHPAVNSIPDAVDHYVEALWKEKNIKPAALADDATLIRRLTLDLNGRIPTAAEVQAYVSSTDAQKKVKLVDRLLASTALVRQQTTEFDAM